jgi:Rab-GTPase-TBC domain
MSNPEMMLGRLDEEKEVDGARAVNGKSSLKDRFKMVRMREEAGITSLPEEDSAPGAIAALVGRSNSLGLGIVSPTNVIGNEKDSMAAEKIPPSPIPTTPNANLAPGTASGVSAGPSAMTDAAVDWDLWQSVVNEGPAAVARTSAEELNKAIATGIPSAIRGVIWQVLAQSKNEDLEMVYKELATRGTEKAKDRNSNSTTNSTTTNGSLSIINETVASSASSMHSEQSGGPNGLSSPTTADDKKSEAALKIYASAAAEKKKKEKEDAAMLQKLEKAIRRDLGARTSYSKFAASAGLQDGLFGVCKAYALFDEGVGYAQGMNFLVMPLLFNVGRTTLFYQATG